LIGEEMNVVSIAPNPPVATENSERALRQAARALARSGLVHAYGHCSVRLDAEHFLVCAAKPMGTLLPSDTGTVVRTSGTLPDGVLGEVRITSRFMRAGRKSVRSAGSCRRRPACWRC
jgi:hypothetical protein